MTDVAGTILCATRGGESSINTQEHAIALAKEHGVDVLFLYVSNVDFMHGGALIKYADMQEELDKMGEFLLLMATERAKAAGVAAESIVKHGVFREALIETANETTAGVVVLGVPSDRSITGREYLRELSLHVKEKTGLDVILVEDE